MNTTPVYSAKCSREEFSLEKRSSLDRNSRLDRKSQIDKKSYIERRSQIDRKSELDRKSQQLMKDVQGAIDKSKYNVNIFENLILLEKSKATSSIDR